MKSAPTKLSDSQSDVDLGSVSDELEMQLASQLEQDLELAVDWTKFEKHNLSLN